MSLRLGTFVIDVNDMKRASAFWSAALDYEATEASDRWTTLSPRKGSGVLVGLQITSDPKREINRVHLDLDADDVQAEVRRLEGLGAKRADWPYYVEGARYVVMLDPDGNEFCVCPA